MTDFGEAVRQQRHDWQDANLGAREIDVDELRRVVEVDHDAVAWPQSHAQQVQCQEIHAALEHTVADALCPADHGVAIAETLRGLIDDVAEGLVAPVAALAVASRELSRPGSEAFEHGGSLSCAGRSASGSRRLARCRTRRIGC